jgi:hypothetical protein
MTTLKHGQAQVELPASLTLPPHAGKLTPDELQGLSKPKADVAQVAHDTAQAIDALGDRFQLPAGVTTADLRAAATAHADLSTLVTEVEVILHTLKQAERITADGLYQQLRKVNDMRKVQAKHDANLDAALGRLVAHMSNH